VLVGAGEEEHLLAELAVMPREDICRHGCVRMPEVRVGVDVIDGSRDRKGHIAKRTLANCKLGGYAGRILSRDMKAADVEAQHGG
jgi:hypothetical protein